MLFNSLEFFLFFFIVYSCYLLLNHRLQNYLLLFSSYVFYGAWDWRFLSLILFSTIVDYFCGLNIHQAHNLKQRKFYLLLSVTLNLCLLGFFKYFNFFEETLHQLIQNFGITLGKTHLNIILPVGISFYTFQTMSYTIDIYHKKLRPTRRFLDFALFVSFFPQLIAGPIERAKHLLPQILEPRKITLESFYQGSFLIFWGLFMKVFIADNLANIVDPVFAASIPQSTVSILTATYAFAFQIFCDFAGYSNIARGIGKCMGFNIMINFNIPYFSSNPSEFWRRWHISLSSWLRDYLYIPLGGNQHGLTKTLRNLTLVMVLGGLWHGAAWTFVFWGLYHGLLLGIYHILTFFKLQSTHKLSSLKNILKPIEIFICFNLICLGWLIFRSQSSAQLFEFNRQIFFGISSLTAAEYVSVWMKIMPYILILLIVQTFQYYKNDLLVVYKSNVFIKTFFYVICILLLTFWGVTDAQDFIYFQF